MKTAIILTLAAVAAIFFSCVKESKRFPRFTNQNEIGIYNNSGSALFRFRKNAHQVWIKKSANWFRVQENDGATVYSCRFTEPPVLGETLPMKLENANFPADVEVGEYTVETVKIMDDMVWLWSPAKSIGFVILWEK